MRGRRLALSFALLGLEVIACGSGDGGNAGTGTSSICPASAPGDGSACSGDFAVCEFGADPSFRCTTRSVCRNGTWRILAPETTPCPTDADTCPISWADANEKPCARQYEMCTYSTGACQCAKADGGFEWACKDLPGNCPDGRPRAGSACDEDAGHRCAYPDCSMVCAGGVWQPDGVCQRVFRL